MPHVLQHRLLERSQQQYRVEFQRVFKNWRKHVVLWKEIFPTAAREWSDPDQPGRSSC